MKLLEQRKEEFKLRLWRYVQDNGGSDKYPIKNLKEFFEYWSEHNEPVTARTKMRFENPSVIKGAFNLGRRLGTWFKNVERYNQNGNGKQRLTADQQKYLIARTDI